MGVNEDDRFSEDGTNTIFNVETGKHPHVINPGPNTVPHIFPNGLLRGKMAQILKYVEILQSLDWVQTDGRQRRRKALSGSEIKAT